MMSEDRNIFGMILPTAWACSNPRKMAVWTFAPCALALMMSPSLASAQGTQTAPPPIVIPPATPPPPSCATKDHRAFDFWVGVWDVTAKGQPESSAVNTITVQHRGCVIREEYKTKGGYSGMSMSFYDRNQKKWHQTWMGVDGSALYIEGGLNERGQMVLSNKNTPYYQEGQPINRVTWTPNKDGSVRQHWQASQDQGKTWSTVFDGKYVKRASVEALE